MMPPDHELMRLFASHGRYQGSSVDGQSFDMRSAGQNGEPKSWNPYASADGHPRRLGGRGGASHPGGLPAAARQQQQQQGGSTR